MTDVNQNFSSVNHNRISIIDLTNFPDSPIPTGSHIEDAVTEPLYKQLQDLENKEGVIYNDKFEYCASCNSFVDVGDGIVFRNCLHSSCTECMRQLILETADFDVKCPVAHCEHSVQDREIQSLLTPEEYEHHLTKNIVPDQNVQNDGNLYQELIDLEQNVIIRNDAPFECEICYTPIEVNEGVVLRDCLHEFCLDCVRNTINHSDEAEIKCPAHYCESILQDREIRTFLTQEDYDKFNQKSLRIAENKATNSYHCKMPNCVGWCLVDDNVNTFVCPACTSANCLTCQAIHTGKNCKEYQDDLRYAGLNDDQRSEAYFDEIIHKNEGMRCTTCKIVIMKRTGCDWLVCSMCKTELCWATKMNRWGPNGRNDRSGGCGCYYPTKKCHPKCGNCH